ncbi:murein biosynthesis integral membrane protein MurJ [Luteipulveratus mongoliensis]|uniref:murein biosynthesis integral membrane protein MurJ n=1 Tax=Luteipulveratus mongoliensis TaxID=571913 RepID=UPI0006966A59|nr:lipid II flippase MurJ [Luteipulveratus mongoliensis]
MSSRAGRASGLAAAAGLIAITTLVARVVGFGRWIAFSGSVGSTCVGEVYATANLLPNVLFEVAAGGALAAVAVPLVAGALARNRRAEADQVASALLTWAMTVLVPLAVLLAVAARPIATWLLGDSSGRGCAQQGRTDLAVTMLLVFAPQIPLYGIGILLAGVLQAHHRFLAAAVAPLLSSLVVIGSYLLYGHLAHGAGGVPERLSGGAVAALSGGTTLGVVALSLPLLIPLRRAGVRLRPTWSFPSGAGRRAVHLAGAGVLALVAQQVAVLATVTVSNHRGGTGTLNVYNYVQALYLLPYAVLAVPIATAAFPSLVGSDDASRRTSVQVLASSLRGVIVAGALGAGLLAATAMPASRFFERIDASRGGVAGSSVPAMEPALIAYAGGLVGFSVIALLLRALYVQGRPWQGGLAVAGGWLIAAVLPPLLVTDHAGSRSALITLGWSSTAGMTAGAVALAVLVARAWGPQVLRYAARTAAAAVLAGIGGAAVGALSVAWADPSSVLTAVLAGLLAAGVALAVFVALLAICDPASMVLLRGRLGRAPRSNSQELAS